MSSGEADRLTHGIHGLMIDNSEPSGGSDTQATLAQKDRSHTAASGRAKQSTETLDRNNVGHVGQKTGSAMTAIQDKWNELTDKMGSGSLKDLKELKKDIEKIVTQIEQHHISFPDDRTLSLDMLRKLHSLLGQLIMHTGDINMISLAIRVSKGALDLIYPGDVQIVTWSNNLGNSYWRRFRSLGVPNDLDMALVYYTQAREHFPRGSQALHSVLFNLANCYLDRFQSRGAPLDLDEAVELYHEALSLVPHGAPETSSHLNGIANALYQRFQLRNERKDLDEAIEYQEKAVNLSNQGDIHSPGWFGNLGNLYQARFELSGKLEDVHRAIDYISRAISRASDKHPSLPGLLRTLGSSYRLRYDRLGIENDINKALEVHTRMLSLTPEGHRELPGRLVALGESYSSRYQQTEQQQDVVSAIDLTHRALLLVPERDPKQPEYYFSISQLYIMRFNSAGTVKDIDNAVDHLHRGLILLPRGHIIASKLLDALGAAYFRRYLRLNINEDIEKSIKFHQEAVQSSRTNLPGPLMNLGNAYCERFNKLNTKNDIESAIDYQARALELLPDRHSSKPGVLMNLGTSYQKRFDHYHDQADIIVAISYLSEALLLASGKNSHKPGIMNALAVAYSCRYNLHGDIGDIKLAIKHYSQARLLAPQGHVVIPTLLHNLGSAYQTLHRIQGDELSLEQSLKCYQESAHYELGDPIYRFSSAFVWARLATVRARPIDEQLNAYTVAMALVPQILLFATKIEEQYEQVRRIGNLALGAAAVAISAQKYDKALEWLEHGRMIVWNHMLRLRSPLDELSVLAPDLACRFRELSIQLNQARFSTYHSPNTPSASYTLEMEAQRYRRAAEEHARLIDQVRQLPGFGTFWKARNADELIRAPCTGPVVVVNVDQFRSDALIISPNNEKVTHIPLPNLAETQLTNARERLLKSLQNWNVRDRGVRVKGSVRPKQKDEFAYILTLLWKGLAKPVLDSLGLQPKPGANDLPRITWCTTGILSFLPLHAAGDYECEDARLFNYAISSYTPTLSGLLKPTPKLDVVATHPTMLVVGQEHTPGQSPLPGTKEEIKCIESHIQSLPCYTKLQDEDATPDNVLTCMEQSDWVHLACHARQDNINPALSGFLLHGSTLSLNLIAQRDSIQNKGLAFLSACQTATGDENLPDEAAHLAAGMLTVGYRSVIATMWSIMDADAPLIADRVYARLLDGKDEIPGQRDTARALHYAIEELRREVGEEAFSRWVPFVHIGV
ncbi:unnamed protein product [Rhizoctonia solani]|uniref:CHAT domain-containing protein n=1 Tax=Rhizoctonia solani TaxID=456999 RepID=A0A8H3A5N7_9AGAM|nr:unnamed protein product [Rhizoctonia solani]